MSGVAGDLARSREAPVMSKLSVWIISPTGDFRPGFYRARLVKGGPYVPVELAEMTPPRDDDGEWLWDFHYRLTVDGEDRDPYSTKDLIGEPVTEAELRYLNATREFDRTHGTPMADARRPVDLLETMPRLF